MTETPRNQTSFEVVEGLTKMFTDQPPSEWSETLTDIDMPTDYMMIFLAFVATVGSLVLPWLFIGPVAGFLAPIVITNKENASFFVNKFLPELDHSSS